MNPPDMIEALAAAMCGQSVEDYRKSVKERARAYRRINEMAAQIRDEAEALIREERT